MKSIASGNCSHQNEEFLQANRLETCNKSSGKADFEDLKEFKCSVCDRILATKQSLKEHMFKHAGEKPFKCTEPGCGMAFRQSSQLCNHRKVHREARLILERQEKKQKKAASGIGKSRNDEVQIKTDKIEVKVMALPPITRPVFGVVLPSFNSLL